MLDLSSDLERMASGLTADMKQKISLGRGLVREDVRAILFDEPLTVIDPHLKWQLRGALKRVHRHSRTTMVYVTHDQTEALTFADKVVVMLEGEVVQIGTPQELFEQPAHTFVGYFIGSPGMNVLPAVVEGCKAHIGDSAITLAPNTQHSPARKRSRWVSGRNFCACGGRPGAESQGASRGRRGQPQDRPGGTRRSAHSGDRGRGRSGACGLPLARARSRARARLRRQQAGEGLTAVDKPVNNRAWLLVVPVVAIVAFNAVLPLMTVVNYSVQDTFGNNQFFWNGVGWYKDLLDPSADLGGRFLASLATQ